MKHFSFARSLLLATMIAAAGATAGMAGDLKMSDKWRIEVSESAKSDGVIRLRVTPDGGEAIDVAVPIPAGQSENEVARHIQDSLGSALDRKTYEVEMDDGEDVLVKRRGGATFNLKLIDTNVRSVRINVDEE
jgi:hypothetical protein